MSSLFRTKLLVHFDFEASHSLDTREAPHPHLWKTVLTFTGEPTKGRIIDFPTLESAVHSDLASLPNSYLNENADLLPEGRAFPTCETLGASMFTVVREKTVTRLRTENSTLTLLSVQVQLCEGAKVYGSAVVEPLSSTS
ncbi:MAG: 6-carboxytetrahydropterin synthase [Bdellovibrionales bacterium]|nr:6-carboxytetrahydropterin synthase [Bdellovibrionales bacterium]